MDEATKLQVIASELSKVMPKEDARFIVSTQWTLDQLPKAASDEEAAAYRQRAIALAEAAGIQIGTQAQVAWMTATPDGAQFAALISRAVEWERGVRIGL